MANFGFQITRLVAEGCRIWVEVHIDEAREVLDLNGIQANVAGGEILQMFGFRRAHQVAIQPIDPRMVGTHDARGLAFTAQEFVRSVLTNIVERAQHAVAVAHNNDGVAGNFGGDEGSWLADLLHVAHPLPGFANDLALIHGEPCRVHIGLFAQRQGP